jgi:hypothetical protein
VNNIPFYSEPKKDRHFAHKLRLSLFTDLSRLKNGFFTEFIWVIHRNVLTVFIFILLINKRSIKTKPQETRKILATSKNPPFILLNR